MKVTSLPKALDLDETAFFQVYDYQTANASCRQMISLTHNTFSFLLNGSKEVFAEQTALSIADTHFLLMTKGNCLMTEQLPNHAGGYRSILFFFSDEALLNFVEKYAIQQSGHKEKTAIHAFQYDSFLKNLVDSILIINKLNAQAQQKLLALKFEELMLYLREIRGNEFILSLTAKITNGHNHFIKTVQTNKLNKLSLSELAFLSNMSIATFKREFEKNFEAPPIKWFQEQRLKHAAFLLKNSSNRASDIFEKAGYETLSTFIQAFKHQYGQTPKQYQMSF